MSKNKEIKEVNITQNIFVWVTDTIKELQKHAEKDDCYSCKQLLKNPIIVKYSEMIKK